MNYTRFQAKNHHFTYLLKKDHLDVKNQPFKHQTPFFPWLTPMKNLINKENRKLIKKKERKIQLSPHIPHKLQELEEWECYSWYQHLRQEKSLQTYPVKGTKNTTQWNKI